MSQSKAIASGQKSVFHYLQEGGSVIVSMLLESTGIDSPEQILTSHHCQIVTVYSHDNIMIFCNSELCTWTQIWKTRV